jgi:hypothetical protein
MGDYSYCSFEDDQLCTWGLHRHGFPMLLWDTLVQTGYGDTPPEYYGRLFEEHDLQHCEVYVEILSHPVFPDGSPWSTWAIGADMSDAMEKATHYPVLAESVCHCEHTDLAVPDPGPLRSEVEGSHG